MTQDLENISSICDNEGWDDKLAQRIAQDADLTRFWRSTHLVRDVLTSEPGRPVVDVSQAVAQALEDEPCFRAEFQSTEMDAADTTAEQYSDVQSSNVVAANFGQADQTQSSAEERKPRPSRVRKWLQQGSQFAVAASFAAFAIIGYQEYYQDSTDEAVIDAPGIPQIGMPQGGLAPVSLATTRPITTPTKQPVTQAEMEALLEERRRLNAIIAHHQQQVRYNASPTSNERADN